MSLWNCIEQIFGRGIRRQSRTFFRYPEHCIVLYNMQTPDWKLVRVFVLSCAVCTLQRVCQKSTFKLNVTRAYSMKHETRHPTECVFSISYLTQRYATRNFSTLFAMVAFVSCNVRGIYVHGERWNGFINFTLNIFDNRDCSRCARKGHNIELYRSRRVIKFIYCVSLTDSIALHCEYTRRDPKKPHNKNKIDRSIKRYICIPI